MFKRIRLLFILGAVIAMSGCMQFAIEGDCPKTPDSIFGKETIHGSFYGFNWDDDRRKVKKINNGLGIYKVEYHTNIIYSFVSLISLGLYVPVDIDYWTEAPSTIFRLPKKRKKLEIN